MIPRARRVLTAAFSALLVLPALTGVAHAAENSVFTVTLAKTPADVQKVAEYWKPDRLRQADNLGPATPASQAVTPAPTPSSSGLTDIVPIKRSPAPIKVSPVLPQHATAAKTMGKVYFRFGDKEYWCSASSVAARNRSVVATAAHCAYDPRQAQGADYWIFVPNPGPNGEAPDGIYVGSGITMHIDWPGKGDYDYDYAFVTVHRGFKWVEKNGRLTMQDVGKLQDNVGGQGLAVSKKVNNKAYAFGYPAGPQPDGRRPFNGKTLRGCTGVTKYTVAPSLDLQYGVQLQPCDFSAGASGGPWLLGYQATRHLGTLNGLNSLTWNRDAKDGYDAVSSPYFNAATGDVYRYAAAQVPQDSVT